MALPVAVLIESTPETCLAEEFLAKCRLFGLKLVSDVAMLDDDDLVELCGTASGELLPFVQSARARARSYQHGWALGTVRSTATAVEAEDTAPPVAPAVSTV